MPKFVIPSIFTAVDKLSGPVARMQAQVDRFGKNAGSSLARGSRSLSALSASADSAYRSLNPLSRLGFLGISVGIAGVTSLLGKFVNEAAKIENAEAAFTPLLGGADKARKMVIALQQAAKDTPFEFETLAKSANLLLGFGAAVESNVVDKMKMLGDVALGDAEKMQGITLAFSQIQAAGKASMQDVNQLINNGVPILGELAKVLGVNEKAIRKMVEQGKATSTVVTKAFENMTSKGGMFFNSMGVASQTFSGKMSTLKDNINMAFADIGMAAMPVLKEFVDRISVAAGAVRDWIGENKQLISQKVAEWGEKIGTVVRFVADNFDIITKAVKWYVIALIALRTISILATGAMYAHQLGLFLFSKSARAATIAQWQLNYAFLANPVTWYIIAIVAVIAIIAVLVSKISGWGEQWDEVMTWMKNVFKLFKLHLLMQWKVLEHAFMTMVEAIVLAWKWAQNKMGLLSDEQYARDKARIQEEKRMRISAIQETAREYTAAVAKVAAGPKFVLRWKGSEADYSANYEKNNTPFPARTYGGGIEAINTRAEQSRAQKTETETTNLNKIMIELGGAPKGTAVKDNPSNIPVKLTPTTGQFG